MDTQDDLLAQYGTDPQMEADGVWCDEFRGGVEIKIRSAQSKQVKAAQATVNRRCERFYKTRVEVPDEIQATNLAMIAAAAVADWRHRTKVAGGADVVTTTIPFQGKALDASEENKATVFGDSRLWSLRLDIIAQANSIDRFKSLAPATPATAAAAADLDD